MLAALYRVEREYTYMNKLAIIFYTIYIFFLFFVWLQLAGGSALESGKIVKGDRVVAVSGQDLRESPVEDIALHVKISNPVKLKLVRYRSAKQ